MKTKLRKTDELIGAEYNPRQISDKQIQELKDSILRFGFVEPVIVNIHPERKDIIISGHQRCRVAREMGIEKVPVVELELSPEKEKELNIRMNKSGGQFDMELLTEYFDRDELFSWGFEDWELPKLDDIDYSILDEENIDEEISDMRSNVKKALQIEFELEDYDRAKEVIKFWRDNDAYIGGMILEYLNEQKNKINEKA
jgi:hypothetical protein